MLMRLFRDLFLWALAPLCFGNKSDHSKNSQVTNVDDSSLILANGGVAARDGGVVNITDGNAMALATSALTTGLGGAFDLVGRSNANALEAMNRSGSAAFEFAGKSNANALTYASNVLDAQSSGLSGFMDGFTELLGFAGATQKTAQGATAANSALVSQAYQDATDSSTGNRTLLLVCVGVVGVVAFAMIFRKGG